MNVFEILKQDHQKVSGIFQQLEQSGGSREQLFTQLNQELSIHAQVEETVFYPALREYEETRELVPEAIEEHAEVKQMLAQLQAMPKTGGEFDSMLTELRESVEHHVEEEESEMFEAARAALSQQQLDELAQRVQQAKQQMKGGAAAG